MTMTPEEHNKQRMTAQELRTKIDEAKYRTTEEILNSLEKLAKLGYSSSKWNYLRPHQIDELRLLGYKVKSEWLFIFKSDTYIISW